MGKGLLHSIAIQDSRRSGLTNAFTRASLYLAKRSNECTYIRVLFFSLSLYKNFFNDLPRYRGRQCSRDCKRLPLHSISTNLLTIWHCALRKELCRDKMQVAQSRQKHIVITSMVTYMFSLCLYYVTIRNIKDDFLLLFNLILFFENTNRYSKFIFIYFYVSFT